MKKLTESSKININGSQLWDSIHELAKIGATARGGVRRLAFSAEDRAGRDWFIDNCQELNLEISRDRIGNIFALMEGKRADLPVVMVGSHLDSQPTGGKYDGAYGVLCALEIARSLYAAGRKPLRTLELVSFANEEGARFAPPMMGSGIFTGHFSVEEMLKTTDFEGITIGEELEKDETGTFVTRPERPIDSFFEIHIEQGPVLEQKEIPIGIVTRAQAQRWYDVTIVGSESHAGPTPMSHRKDALMAAAEVALMVEKIALAQAPEGRGTVGTLSLSPFSRNVIPGRVQMTIDTRHPVNESLDMMDAALRQAVAAIANARGVAISLTEFWHSPMTPFNEALIQRLEHHSQERGYASHRLSSGAGHDAVYMARMGIPTAMLFVPTKDGISHNESESITRKDAIAGCQVLCDAVVERLFSPDGKTKTESKPQRQTTKTTHPLIPSQEGNSEDSPLERGLRGVLLFPFGLFSL